jgi:hypothetical protein
LLNGEEAAIGATATLTRILGVPSSIIAGQSVGGRLHQHYWHHNERCHNLGFKAHRQASSGRISNNTARYSFTAIDGATLAQDPTNPAGRDSGYNERRRLQRVTTEGGKKE